MYLKSLEFFKNTTYFDISGTMLHLSGYYDEARLEFLVSKALFCSIGTKDFTQLHMLILDERHWNLSHTEDENLGLHPIVSSAAKVVTLSLSIVGLTGILDILSDFGKP